MSKKQFYRKSVFGCCVDTLHTACPADILVFFVCVLPFSSPGCQGPRSIFKYRNYRNKIAKIEATDVLFDVKPTQMCNSMAICATWCASAREKQFREVRVGLQRVISICSTSNSGGNQSSPLLIPVQSDPATNASTLPPRPLKTRPFFASLFLTLFDPNLASQRPPLGPLLATQIGPRWGQDAS